MINFKILKSIGVILQFGFDILIIIYHQSNMFFKEINFNIFLNVYIMWVFNYKFFFILKGLSKNKISFYIKVKYVL